MGRPIGDVLNCVPKKKKSYIQTCKICGTTFSTMDQNGDVCSDCFLKGSDYD